ncbi:MAG: hydroxyacylglutathione hydrolase [Flavobacterium sp.]|jgi:hydroxyacylglutathione hydrolase
MALLISVGLIVSERHRLLLHFIGTGEPSKLLDAGDESSKARWFDDYYIIHALDENTFAIGEPRYDQKNFNYLILGNKRAILFDAGSGMRDINPVVNSLTNLPLTFVPSHLHYDHIGNNVEFDRIALVDLPHLRERVKDGYLQLKWQEHLGETEGYEAPKLKIHEWLSPAEVIDIGDRELTVLFTPGHTDNSISLLDNANHTIFSGDFIYPGDLYAFLPGSNLGDYLQGAKNLISSAGPEYKIYGAHRSASSGLPIINLQDVTDLRETLEAIQNHGEEGEGFYPLSFKVNKRINLLTEPSWLQTWNPRYPELTQIEE